MSAHGEKSVAISRKDMQRLRRWRSKLALASYLTASKKYGKGVNSLRGKFCVDSGATRTLLKKSRWLRRILHRVKLTVSDAVGKVHPSQGHGPLELLVQNRRGVVRKLGGVGSGFVLENLLFNLLSVSQLARAGCTVVFSGRGAYIRTHDGDIVPLQEQGGLYFLRAEPQRKRESRPSRRAPSIERAPRRGDEARHRERRRRRERWWSQRGDVVSTAMGTAARGRREVE